jgi:hypothetical protein
LTTARNDIANDRRDNGEGDYVDEVVGYDNDGIADADDDDDNHGDDDVAADDDIYNYHGNIDS